MTRHLLSGWGRTPAAAAEVVHPGTEADVAALLGSGHDRRGTIGRGRGRSYGDAAQRAGGTVVRADLLDVRIALDHTTGVVTASPDVTIGDLLAHLVPQGWFVPVTPGTRHVSVAGAVAADVHGKNHHADGTWGQHLESLRLVTPAGGPLVLTAESDPDLWWATLGGMGLTGVLSEVRFRALPVDAATMLVDTWRTADLDETMAVLRDTDGPFRYTVAWLDLLARGTALGRGVVTAGDHAPAGHDDRALPAELVVPAPPAPSWLLNRLSIAAFNEAWFRKAPRREEAAPQSIGQFFYPLDLAEGWNRLYGRAAFAQWQVVVPDGAEPLLRSIVERLAEHRVPSFLTVLKRFGPANPGPLSFPLQGWTLALDTPAGPSFPRRLLDRMDHEVADAGGRVYLAKDARLDPTLLAAMYPRLDEWREVAERADPDHVLRSDLSERLHLR